MKPDQQNNPEFPERTDDVAEAWPTVQTKQPRPVTRRTAAAHKIPRYLLNLAGEYRVCSELNLRGMFATVTYGNRKGADLYVISDERQRALKVEVKTSQRKNFVTGITQKGLERDPTAPDFWVLLQVCPHSDGTFAEQFFVLSHAEICEIQKARNERYAELYKTKHGRDADLSRGVDSVTTDDVEIHRSAWSKILEQLERGTGS